MPLNEGFSERGKVLKVLSKFFDDFPIIRPKREGKIGTWHTDIGLSDPDFFIGYLWLKGYKVVSLEDEYDD